VKAPSPCSASGCERPVYARGLCQRDYLRWFRTDPDRPACAVDGCGKRAIALGWCGTHYARWKRLGSPTAVRGQIKHGHCAGGASSPTRVAWSGMRNASRRHGIEICERWRAPREGFANFLADMRERPPGMRLARIDDDGPFAPENCRWVTEVEPRALRRPKGRLEKPL
jgi:hypothetical protein